MYVGCLELFNNNNFKKWNNFKKDLLYTGNQGKRNEACKDIEDITIITCLEFKKQ